MPRRKKKAHELTDEEAMRKMFPKKVREHAKAEGHGAQKSKAKTGTSGKPS